MGMRFGKGKDRLFAQMPRLHALLLTTLAFLATAATSISIDLCGNFCGPSWCNGGANSECEDVEGAGCAKVVFFSVVCVSKCLMRVFCPWLRACISPLTCLCRLLPSSVWLQ